uniref:Uncharacterized protein n=1 Tax=Salix viminalis TaxID=40686 RepID=A0A6N2LSQ9_SALVM
MAGVLHSLPGSNFRRMGHSFKLHYEYQNVNPSIESGQYLGCKEDLYAYNGNVNVSEEPTCDFS